jgi:hypothetical protein
VDIPEEDKYDTVRDRDMWILSSIGVLAKSLMMSGAGSAAIYHVASCILVQCPEYSVTGTISLLLKGSNLEISRQDVDDDRYG